ncbi:MAG TPA: hypothetical protein VMN36_08450 [Verrucomicrobiales bacterium]|nr:hypothetical protein [Verrucomicrobiales bacterium]
MRLDWEQGNHYRDKFGFVLGTGDQLFLERGGSPIPPGGGEKVYGRHGEDLTPAVLDRVRKAAGAQGRIETLDLDWFWWPRKASAKRGGGFYPPPVDAIAQYARLPIAELDGPLPEALLDSAFLKRHVRQFIWKRGAPDGESVLRVRRVRDGLPKALPEELAVLGGEHLEADKLGPALDQAWLSYMKDRPFTSRGYLENEHGGWMRQVAPQMLQEDATIRERAQAGTLQPPGRLEMREVD